MKNCMEFPSGSVNITDSRSWLYIYSIPRLDSPGFATDLNNNEGIYWKKLWHLYARHTTNWQLEMLGQVFAEQRHGVLGYSLAPRSLSWTRTEILKIWVLIIKSIMPISLNYSIPNAEKTYASTDSKVGKNDKLVFSECPTCRSSKIRVLLYREVSASGWCSGTISVY